MAPLNVVEGSEALCVAPGGGGFVEAGDHVSGFGGPVRDGRDEEPGAVTAKSRVDIDGN